MTPHWRVAVQLERGGARDHGRAKSAPVDGEYGTDRCASGCTAGHSARAGSLPGRGEAPPQQQVPQPPWCSLPDGDPPSSASTATQMSPSSGSNCCRSAWASGSACSSRNSKTSARAIRPACNGPAGAGCRGDRRVVSGIRIAIRDASRRRPHRADPPGLCTFGTPLGAHLAPGMLVVVPAALVHAGRADLPGRRSRHSRMR